MVNAHIGVLFRGVRGERTSFHRHTLGSAPAWETSLTDAMPRCTYRVAELGHAGGAIAVP